MVSRNNGTVLEAYQLTKIYPRGRPLYKQILAPFGRRQQVRAVDSVSLRLEAGRILGVVGPNGAGKTTLLRILADTVAADSGTVRICGQRLRQGDCRIRSRIGYVPSDERSFFWRLTGRENLAFFARLYGLSVKQATERTHGLIEQFRLGERADHLFRDYSTGMRKKVAVMRALLHRPSLLLLDEVTNSLDLGSAEMVKQLVRQYVSQQHDRAAVWSTHRLEEISQLCDSVVMLDSGRTVSAGYTERPTHEADYVLTLENLNDQIDTFCQKAGCTIETRTVGDNTVEILISGISEKQLSRIVSLAVKDFGAYITFAGCINKEDPERRGPFPAAETRYGCDY